MKTSSAKAKGRRLQDAIRDKLRSRFLKYGLEDDDIQSAIMGESGTDVKLSPAARLSFPYSTECKNQEKINIWSAIKQAEENAPDGLEPVVFFKRNRSKTYAVIEVDHFFDLVESRIEQKLLTEN
jgi:hypothetical protein